MLIQSFLLGLLHALEIDHVAAILNLVSLEKENKKTKLFNAALWGVGHSVSFIIIGILVFVFKLNGILSFSNTITRVLGAVLILLAFFRLYLLLKKQTTFFSNKKYGLLFPLLIGLIHGTAGTGGIFIITVSQANQWQYALTYIFLFSVGIIIAIITLVYIITTEKIKKIFFLSNKYFIIISIIGIVLCFWIGIKFLLL